MRKSQRKRKTNQKFTDEEYALDDNEMSLEEENLSSNDNSNSLSENKNIFNHVLIDSNSTLDKSNSDSEKKGMLKLRIKRVPCVAEDKDVVNNSYVSAVLINTIENNNNNKTPSPQPRHQSQPLHSELVVSIKQEELNCRTSIDSVDFLDDKKVKLSLYSPDSAELNIKVSPSTVSANMLPNSLTNKIQSPRNRNISASSMSPLAGSVRKVSANVPLTRATSKLLKQQLSSSEENNSLFIPSNNNVKNTVDDDNDDEDYEINYDDDDDEDYHDDDYDDEMDIENRRSKRHRELNLRVKKNKLESSKELTSSVPKVCYKNNEPSVNRHAKTLSHIRSQIANRKRTKSLGKSTNHQESFENVLKNDTTNLNKEIQMKQDNNGKTNLTEPIATTKCGNDSYDSNINKIVHELKSIGTSKSI